jgi:uncharacterized membrane protein YhhN
VAAYHHPVTTPAWIWLAAAVIAAAADWLAVATDRRRLEYLAKPAVMVALVGLAISLEPGSSAGLAARPWFVAALALSLVGDVLLMLPRERFVGGLVAFLLAHLAYIVGIGIIVSIAGFVAGGLVLGLLIVGVVLALAGRRIVGAVRLGRPGLLAPVGVYMAVISAMVIVACVSGRPAAMAGAALFYGSDAILAWDRFVDERHWGKLATHVTYHAGQALLVLSLLA